MGSRGGPKLLLCEKAAPLSCQRTRSIEIAVLLALRKTVSCEEKTYVHGGMHLIALNP